VAELKFLKEYILENKFVRLTPMKRSHINSLLEISKDEDIWVYFLEKGNGLKNLTAYIDNTIKKRKEKKEYAFIVFDKLKNQFVGTTRFYEYSSELKTIKLGHTWYGKEFRGTGINKNCKYLLFQFAFEKLEVERVGFGAYIDNTISVAAMKSVGCQKEGVLKNMFPAINGNGRTDAILMSILKNDWLEREKHQLNKKINN
tara:strand:+ start:26739 stop:27341 length:603 start_codon:yes stop_codon:yes gene_type:complete